MAAWTNRLVPAAGLCSSASPSLKHWSPRDRKLDEALRAGKRLSNAPLCRQPAAIAAETPVYTLSMNTRTHLFPHCLSFKLKQTGRDHESVRWDHYIERATIPFQVYRPEFGRSKQPHLVTWRGPMIGDCIKKALRFIYFKCRRCTYFVAAARLFGGPSLGEVWRTL